VGEYNAVKDGCSHNNNKRKGKKNKQDESEK
jgi:hypothetical protein